MITQYRPAYYDNPRASTLSGLSTDQKPTDVENGARYEEIDTGKTFCFDKENKAWYEMPQSGGGGSSVSVEPITITKNGVTTAPEGTAYSPVTVDVPAPVTSVNGATGDVKTNWYCHATYSNSSDSVIMDKTVAEIYAAYKAGYNVKCTYDDDTLSSNGTIPLVSVSSGEYCIFSGTGAEEALLTPTAPVTRTIYYDHDSSAWKYTSIAAPSSYVVKLKEKDGVLTADKTYDEIQAELLSQLMSGGEFRIALLDNKSSVLMQFTSTVDNKFVFQGTTESGGHPVLVTDVLDSNNTWTSTTTSLDNLVVNLIGSEDDAKVDKTFEQMLTAYNADQNITLDAMGMIGYLFSVDDSSIFFKVDALNIVIMVGIQSDNTVSIERINMFPLTVNLSKSGDTYSGDTTFADIQTTLDFGQTVQVDYSGTHLYLATQTDTQLLFTGLIVSGDGVTATCATVQSDDTWTYRKVIIKEPTSGS